MTNALIVRSTLTMVPALISNHPLGSNTPRVRHSSRRATAAGVSRAMSKISTAVARVDCAQSANVNNFVNSLAAVIRNLASVQWTLILCVVNKRQTPPPPSPRPHPPSPRPRAAAIRFVWNLDAQSAHVLERLSPSAVRLQQLGRQSLRPKKPG